MIAKGLLCVHDMPGWIKTLFLQTKLTGIDHFMWHILDIKKNIGEEKKKKKLKKKKKIFCLNNIECLIEISYNEHELLKKISLL